MNISAHKCIEIPKS